MASLRCHGNLDSNKTQIIRNFHLYVTHLLQPFSHIFTHAEVVNAQPWEVSPPKKSSRATLLLNNYANITICRLSVRSEVVPPSRTILQSYWHLFR